MCVVYHLSWWVAVSGVHGCKSLPLVVEDFVAFGARQNAGVCARGPQEHEQDEGELDGGEERYGYGDFGGEVGAADSFRSLMGQLECCE